MMQPATDGTEAQYVDRLDAQERHTRRVGLGCETRCGEMVSHMNADRVENRARAVQMLNRESMSRARSAFWGSQSTS